MSHTEFTREQQQALHDPWQWVRFQFLPGGVIGIVALGQQWPEPTLAWQGFWTLFTAYCMFCWTSCFHETVHQTLTPNRKTSILLGRLLGTAIFVPYSVYRESHIRHHAYLNKPTDWELWPYSDPKAGLWFRRVFVWFDFFLGVFAAIVTYGRIFWHQDSPITDRKLRRTIYGEYAFAVAFWGALFAIFTLTDSWHGYLRAWLIPSCIAGIFQSIRKFTEHLGMASYDPMVGTRTVVGRNWFTRMCTYLNFDIFVHGPHHRHPLVPHRTLKQKMKEYVEKQPELQYPMFRTYTGAVLDTIPFMFRNPGVGMNAGSEAPDQEKRQTENFVADVVEEVLSERDRVSASV
ncbi:fatty acid desaturase [bacterium]|nr:fatty acid desaturase [bacterium]